MQRDIVSVTTRELARLQPFTTSNWRGGLCGSPSMAGTRPARPIAAGWAVLHHLGMDGYLCLAEDTHQAATARKQTVLDTAGLARGGAPDAPAPAVAFGGALRPGPGAGRRWPERGSRVMIDQLGADLRGGAGELAISATRAEDRSTSYGTA